MLQHFIYVMCSFVQKGFEFKFNLKMSFKNLLKNKKGNPFPSSSFGLLCPAGCSLLFSHLSQTLVPTHQFLPSSPATAPSPSHAHKQRLELKSSAPHSHSSPPRPLSPRASTSFEEHLHPSRLPRSHFALFPALPLTQTRRETPLEPPRSTAHHVIESSHFHSQSSHW